MKNSILAVLLLLAGASDKLMAADWAENTQPAYRVVENFTDGLYGFLSHPISSLVLPDTLAEQWQAAPKASSSVLFSNELHRRQALVTRDLINSMPKGTVTGGDINAWRQAALRAESKALINTFADVMLDRYGLVRFGKSSGLYMSDASNWDSSLMTSAMVFGSAYTFIAGVSATVPAGAVVIDFDTRPGNAFLNAAKSGDAKNLASVRITARGTGFSIKSTWGLHDYRAIQESIGFDYACRF